MKISEKNLFRRDLHIFYSNRLSKCFNDLWYSQKHYRLTTKKMWVREQWKKFFLVRILPPKQFTKKLYYYFIFFSLPQAVWKTISIKISIEKVRRGWCSMFVSLRCGWSRCGNRWTLLPKKRESFCLDFLKTKKFMQVFVPLYF